MAQRILLFSLLLFSLSGCQSLIDRKIKDAMYIKAYLQESTAKHYLREGKVDSAFKLYRSSIATYKMLDKKATPGKDSLYSHRVSMVYSTIGYIHDSLHHYDSAIFYQLKALNWTYKAHDPLLTISLINFNLGYNYRQLGDSLGRQTRQGQGAYTTGVKYMEHACAELDSAKIETQLTLDEYTTTIEMYNVLKQPANAVIYDLKYSEIYNKLHPDNPLPSNDLKSKRDTVKSGSGSNKTGTC